MVLLDNYPIIGNLTDNRFFRSIIVQTDLMCGKTTGKSRFSGELVIRLIMTGASAPFPPDMKTTAAPGPVSITCFPGNLTCSAAASKNLMVRPKDHPGFGEWHCLISCHKTENARYSPRSGSSERFADPRVRERRYRLTLGASGKSPEAGSSCQITRDPNKKFNRFEGPCPASRLLSRASARSVLGTRDRCYRYRTGSVSRQVLHNGCNSG